MKSERQKKIDKHANRIMRKKRLRLMALTISAVVVSIPLYIKYMAS